ncbi:MAG: dTMP kinase [bacterium]
MNSPIISGRFIAVEGIDGGGKSTQAVLLANWLNENGLETILTREPGGTLLGEKLRHLIMDAELKCDKRAELLMILAARAQHVHEKIMPALKRGINVICDRFTLSSLAYQGYGRGLTIDEISSADRFATAGLAPHFTVVLDLPMEIMISRIGERSDRFEGEGLEFLSRIAEGYRDLAIKRFNTVLINGDAPIDEVAACIRGIVCSHFGWGKVV